MRRAPAPLLVLLAAIAGDASARPPPRHEVPSVDRTPRAEASTSSLVVLRAPAFDEVRVDAGTFPMGLTEAEVNVAVLLCEAEHVVTNDLVAKEACTTWFSDEEPVHDVYLDELWMDRTEVTVAAYERCVEAGSCDEPPYATGGERFHRDDLPVVLVAWRDADHYCRWAGKRLPTEAEWERAARGATGRRYPWGNVYNPALLNHGRSGWSDREGEVAATLEESDGFLEIAPPGLFRDGRTPEGIADLAGNVAEWVADYYASTYSAVAEVNPKGPEVGDYRVVRGGAYGGVLYRQGQLPNEMLTPSFGAAVWQRSTARAYFPPSTRYPWIGFRCAHNRAR